MRCLLIAFVVLALGGCIAADPVRQEPLYHPTYPELVPAQPATAGTLYVSRVGVELFSDRKALAVGDVVTIRLEERTTSTKSSETSLRKSMDTELPNPSLFGNLVRGSAAAAGMNAAESSTNFTGGGDSDQSNSLTGTITAIVAGVLPNGLMQVQGEKWLQLNRGEEYVRVSGLVRPEDVNGQNEVSSLRLADARIAYSGTGELAESNRAGWLTRFFLHPLFPL